MLCCTKFLLLLLAISKRHKKKLNMAEKGGVVPWCSALQWVLIETGLRASYCSSFVIRPFDLNYKWWRPSTASGPPGGSCGPSLGLAGAPNWTYFEHECAALDFRILDLGIRWSCASDGFKPKTINVFLMAFQTMLTASPWLSGWLGLEKFPIIEKNPSPRLSRSQYCENLLVKNPDKRITNWNFS